jgi:hypothetical protein
MARRDYTAPPWYLDLTTKPSSIKTRDGRRIADVLVRAHWNGKGMSNVPELLRALEHSANVLLRLRDLLPPNHPERGAADNARNEAINLLKKCYWR